MKQKLKPCDGCGKDSLIWKNHEGNKYCKYCWSCQKNTSQKPTSVLIPRVSAKRAKKDQEYSKLRQRYLEKHPVCEINVEGCSITATDIHHTYAGSNRDAFYLVQSTWKACCRNCHEWVHANPSIARELGFLK